MGSGRSSGAPGPGYRAFKVEPSGGQREALRALYEDVVRLKAKAKSLLYYREEWGKALESAVEARASAGKRTPPKAPPLHLLLRFILPDGTVKGNRSAPAVVDLRRAELRIPSYGIRIPLRPSLVRTLLEENNLEPRPEFVAQVTHSGKLRIIACRILRSELALPLRVVTIDENSAHGFSIAVWDLSAKAVLADFEKLRPPNHGFRRKVASLLQSFADKPSEETKNQLAKILPPEALKTLTPERARELAEAARRKERRLNDDFIRKLVAKVRAPVRDALKKGMAALILIDPINSDSLRGTRLQGTLLRAKKLLKNMAVYEGAAFKMTRVSGKVCPRCHAVGVEVMHTKRSRIYECSRCGARWDRDKGVHYNMVYSHFERLRKEECDDLTVLAARVLAALEEWLERHPNILTY